MMKYLQINLRGSKAAQSMMQVKAANESIDFIFASEYYRTEGTSWYPDTNNRAAIVNVNRTQIEEEGLSEPGFRWITVCGTRLYSCYWSPSTTYLEYRDFLDRLERSIRSAAGEVLVAGDFNAHHSDWGSSINDRRGDALSDMVHATGMVTCNRGKHPTFISGSIIDVTFASTNIARKITSWSVSDEETLSDHMYIRYDTLCVHGTQPIVAKKKRKIDFNKLDVALAEKRLSLDTDSHSADECAAAFVTKIQSTCTVEVPAGCRRRSVHW